MKWIEDSQRKCKEEAQPWLRYVDDTFIVRNGSNEQLYEFSTKINQVRPPINFTITILK